MFVSMGAGRRGNEKKSTWQGHFAMMRLRFLKRVQESAVNGSKRARDIFKRNRASISAGDKAS